MTGVVVSGAFTFCAVFVAMAWMIGPDTHPSKFVIFSVSVLVALQMGLAVISGLLAIINALAARR